jgi:hypothetical protein
MPVVEQVLFVSKPFPDNATTVGPTYQECFIISLSSESPASRIDPFHAKSRIGDVLSNASPSTGGFGGPIPSRSLSQCTLNIAGEVRILSTPTHRTQTQSKSTQNTLSPYPNGYHPWH